MTDQDPLDDRLRGYLRARADVPVPAGLMESARVAPPPPRRAWRSWPRVAFALVAVMVAAVLIGTRILNEPNQFAVAPSPSSGASIGRSPAASTQVVPGATPEASGASTGVVPDATLEANGFPDTVLGLPVITVAAARSLITGDQHPGRAMAVGGWWSSPAYAISCPAVIGYEPPIVGRCALEALSPTDAVAGHRSSDGYSWGPPSGSILARQVQESSGTSELWKNVDPQSDARELPQRVVVIAHSGDIRARQCVIETIASCEQELVIDSFAWVEGRMTDALVDTAGSWNLDPDAARAAIEATLPAGQIVTFGPQSAENVQWVDPRIPLDSAPVWIGRVITGPPDRGGTAALDEVLVGDATGLTQTLPMALDSDHLPATITLNGVGAFLNFSDPPTVFVAITHQGLRMTEAGHFDGANAAPAVLAAGDYRIEVWARDLASNDSRPSIPPITTCAASLHVTAGEMAAVTITWQKAGSCSIETPGPAPTTGP